MTTLGILKVLLTADTGQFKKDLANGQKAVKGFQVDVKNMAKSLGVGIGFAAVTKGFKEIIDNTTEYAKSVEDLSRSLGIGTEEASKLLQITDDLEISQSALETGMKNALRQGIAPNIEGMKDLAREYQSLQTPAEKAAFALETFGKNGLQMAKILEKTPDQIDAMAKALEGSSLIMSEDAVQAAKENRLALDEMKDAYEEMSITIGNKAIPKVTEFYKLIGEMASLEADTWFQDGADAAANFINVFLLGKKPVEDLSGAMAIGMGNLREYEGGMRGVAGAADEAAAANSRVAISIMDATKAAMGREAIDLLTKAYQEGAIAEEDYEGKLTNIMANWLELPGDQIVASLALRDIKEDMDEGKFSTMGAYDAVMLFGQSLSALDGKVVRTEVITKYTGVGATPEDWTRSAGYIPPGAPSATSRTGTTPRPTGSTRPRERGGQFGLDMDVPAGYPNDSYPIRATSGEHVTITPRGESQFDEKKLARAIRDALLQVMQ